MRHIVQPVTAAPASLCSRRTCICHATLSNVLFSSKQCCLRRSRRAHCRDSAQYVLFMCVMCLICHVLWLCVPAWLWPKRGVLLARRLVLVLLFRGTGSGSMQYLARQQSHLHWHIPHSCQIPPAWTAPRQQQRRQHQQKGLRLLRRGVLWRVCQTTRWTRWPRRRPKKLVCQPCVMCLSDDAINCCDN